MVPADKIIERAIAEKVDMIGLSGLITPSLEEMVYVATELEKRGLDFPLLIGGRNNLEDAYGTEDCSRVSRTGSTS